MALSADELKEVVHRLAAVRRKEAERLDVIHAALTGTMSDIYVPRAATQEYKQLVDQARFNVVPLVVGSLAQALYVDGFRPNNSDDNAAVWDEVWQPNRMDAKQAGTYRAAVGYGAAYELYLRDNRGNAPSPVSITPYSPRQLTALFADAVRDEWPEYAAVWGRRTSRGEECWLYDDQQAYGLLVGESGDPEIRRDGNGQELVRTHGTGVVPVVRFLESYDDLDDGPAGKVWPLIPAQRQLNQITFSLLMAMQYGSFRQRWVTGMAIPEDANGAPVEPFNTAVNRVWHAVSPDTRFGDFAETSLAPILEARDKVLLYIANQAQIPPHHMVVGAGISNISAEALAALEAGHRQDIVEHQQSFGESREQGFRLAGLLLGDREAWEDRSSEVVWRDMTPRSLGQVADAWGKAVQMLEVPADETWQYLPGVTQQTARRWRGKRADAVLMRELEAMNGGPGGEPTRSGADAGAPPAAGAGR